MLSDASAERRDTGLRLKDAFARARYVAPAGTLVWATLASTGTAIGEGAPILDLLDCRRRFVRAQDATLGMYVESFGGNWLSHPFWKAKFLISSSDDLAKTRTSEVEVVIDTAKGCDIAPPDAPDATRWPLRSRRTETCRRSGPAFDRRGQDTVRRLPTRPDHRYRRHPVDRRRHRRRPDS